MRLNLEQQLGPYQILSLVSAGGMGEVYKARDTRLGRLVAVKVLTGVGREPADALARFQREAQAAGALNHPNVLLVHDVGEFEGQPYFVSELIEGGTLREQLQRGPLSAPAAAQYGAQIARGLSAAHQQGIVHRDLKPENVMLTLDGRVKIVDFGVATLDAPLLDDPDAPPSTGALRTMPGTVFGTVAYMSPEQLRGEAVDHRTDIFSLGVLLYEALEGTRPFDGTTTAELIAAVLRDDPPPERFAPGALARVVRRCLEKMPAARYQSAADLAEELEAIARPAADAAVRLPLATPASAAQAVRSVAVLPFANLAADPENEYFSDGLTEELIHALSRVRGLRVVAWSSASKLKGRDDVQAAAARLGASLLLTGSVRKVGDRVRVAARLTETASAYLLWSGTYDRRLEDLFAIQEEIARSIVGTLAERLELSGTAGSRHQPASHEAYNLYLKGRYFWNQRTRAGLLKGIECFEAALAVDPASALAHAGLADAYCLMVEYGLMAPADGMPRAREAALRALTVDPLSAEAHASFGLIRALYDWEWLEAEALFRRSLELNPGYATAHHWFSIDILAALGRFDEAHEEIEAARRLDPLSLIIAEGHSYLFTLAHRYDEAAEGFQGLLDLDPSYYKAYSSLGRVYVQQGRYDEAAGMLEKARELAGDLPSILAALGQAHGFAGRSDQARAIVHRLQALEKDGAFVPATSYALVYTGLGDHDAAFGCLARAVERRELSLSLVKVHPAYDRLRPDPRFGPILQQLRL
jgi:eukaryotic-like serine/threonine-protein kinase